MKDPRFLPIEYHEPMEESDDDFLENDDEAAENLLMGKQKGSVKKLNLYIAS